MDERLIDLYDKYTHAPLERRVFIKRLTALAGSSVAAMALLPVLDSNYAFAATVLPTDARIDASHISYSHNPKVYAYLARPKGTAKLPAVVVIHDNRGLTPHIEDVARRVALEGYLALAPDLLTSVGGTPANEDAARQLFTEVKPGYVFSDVLSGVTYLERRADATGKIGCVGFSWGGTVANLLVVFSDLAAVVAFYGNQPGAFYKPRTRAKLLLHYAGSDDRINAGIPAYEAALKSAGVNYTKHMYEGTQHDFFNDTASARYNKEAAELAWRRTVEFLNAALKS